MQNEMNNLIWEDKDSPPLSLRGAAGGVGVSTRSLSLFALIRNNGACLPIIVENRNVVTFSICGCEVLFGGIRLQSVIFHK